MKKISLRFVIFTCLLKLAMCQVDVYVEEHMTRREARQYCEKFHIKLSSIENKAEEEALIETAKHHGRPLVWIGPRNGEGSWRKDSLGEASFFNWDDQTPQQTCVAHSVTGWVRINCNTNLPFYCYDDPMFLVKEKKTWEEAMAHCRHLHKDLVSLPSEWALEEVQKVSNNSQTERVWTGLRFLGDTWLWVKGENVTYKAWGQGEMPNCPDPTLRCGALSLTGDHWESWDCADKLNFVCQ